MAPLVLDRCDFRDRVRACWLGKNIGGTLGAPWECRLHTHALDFYEPVPTEPAANDDLDLQLVWLKMLEDEAGSWKQEAGSRKREAGRRAEEEEQEGEEGSDKQDARRRAGAGAAGGAASPSSFELPASRFRSLDPSVRTFAEYWSRYAQAYPWNEYGFFMRNFARGLRPPVAGCFENYFVDEMGSPIRSEIWACLHPGDPDAAARMAWKDSALDHAGGEGTRGEMFWAAVESAAFVESDPMTLIRIGLNVIPLAGRVARSIREAAWCHANGLTWGEARERIAKRFAGIQPCDAVPNHAFIIIGWLYGKDFGDRLCKAVNCGYDTDCTGATLGSLLGILGGTAGIPDRWREPVGEDIVLHKFTGDCDAPRNIDELTDRTVALAEQVAATKPHVAFGDETTLPDDLRTRLFRSDLARAALAQDNHAGVELLDGREVRLHYGGEPVLYPGVGKEVWVWVEGDSQADVRGEGQRVDLDVPAAWTCERLGPLRFRLFSEKPVDDRNTVTVTLGGKSVAFTMLGPGEAQGFGAGNQVPTCPKCRARIEACICGKRV